jgi:hypothetical protein
MGGGFIVAIAIVLMAFLIDSGYVVAGVAVAIVSIPAAIAFESLQN